MITINKCLDGSRALVIMAPDSLDVDRIRVSMTGGSVVMEGSRNAFEDLCAALKCKLGLD